MLIAPQADFAATSPPTSAILVDAIQSRFDEFARGNPKAKCLLMIDPALRDVADNAEFEQCLQAWRKTATEYKFPVMRIRWKHPNLMPAHCPYLLTLNPRREADARLLELSAQFALDDWALDSLSQCRGHRICGWVMTEPHPALYFGHLAVRKLPPDTPNAGQQTLLRFYDPSVMPHLWRISDASQREQLLGPVHVWLMLDRALQLTQYQIPNKSTDHLATALPLLKYRPEQWLTINNIGALNQAIVQWQINHAGQPPTLAQIDAAALALIRARQHGINDEADLKTFAWHALTIHPAFDEHPLIRQALTRLPHEEYYTAAVADLSEQEWHQVQLGPPNP